jgi:hypothetical protein
MGSSPPEVVPGTTPVTVVKGPPPSGSRWRRVGKGALALSAPFVTAVMTTLLIGIMAPKIAGYVALANPTCDDPRGLVEIPTRTISATGPHKYSPADGQRATVGLYAPVRAFDHYTGSIWVPPMLGPDERPPGISSNPNVAVFAPNRSTLTLNLGAPHDVRLICVVNGLANGYPNYIHWARVRTVKAWSDDINDADTSTLRSLDSGSFENYQGIKTPSGTTSVIHIQLVDVYQGQQITSVDPDLCHTRRFIHGIMNDPRGCNLDPAPLAGLSEVIVYEHGNWDFWDVITHSPEWF